MLTNMSINILVQTDERTHVFKRKESSPRKKSMYIIIQTISAERSSNKGINKVTRKFNHGVTWRSELKGDISNSVQNVTVL